MSERYTLTEVHFFDDIRLEASSRVTYGRKVRVDSGQRLTIVAAKEDTADTGGSTENAGLQFYWSVCEYDEMVTLYMTAVGVAQTVHGRLEIQKMGIQVMD